MSTTTENRVGGFDGSGNAFNWEQHEREIALSGAGVLWVMEDVGRQRLQSLAGRAGRSALNRIGSASQTPFTRGLDEGVRTDQLMPRLATPAEITEFNTHPTETA
jgi:hypothetical protein